MIQNAVPIPFIFGKRAPSIAHNKVVKFLHDILVLHGHPVHLQKVCSLQ